MPSSLACVPPTRLGLLTQGHLCRFLVRSPGVLPRSLFTGSRHRPKPPYGSLFTPSPGSHHYGSPQASALKQDDSPARLSPKRRERSLRRRAYPGGAGILTCFPFGHVVLRMPLGPTNPRLTIIAEEASPLRRWGFSPHFAATTAGILIPARSTGAHAPASAQTGRLPTRWACAPPGYRWPA